MLPDKVKLITRHSEFKKAINDPGVLRIILSNKRILDINAIA